MYESQVTKKIGWFNLSLHSFDAKPELTFRIEIKFPRIIQENFLIWMMFSADSFSWIILKRYLCGLWIFKIYKIIKYVIYCCIFVCTLGKKISINSNTNYLREMKLVRINIDYCPLEFDALKFFLGGLSTWGGLYLTMILSM